ncbi:MAG: ribonuclease P protein component [Gammaproteobacteria bacterium]|nr:ribonuclease P protein component [Gammaproteobacteria bacterium]
MNAGFPRSLRLTDSHEYNSVFSEARRLVTPGLVLLFRENGLNYDRLGLAISKKHIKQAVLRNLAKRLAREQFRLSQNRFSGVDIVILSRASLCKFDRQQIGQQLISLWEKLQSHREK